MQILHLARGAVRRPQFGLRTLLSFVTLVSLGLAFPASREHAYRQRLAAAQMLQSSSEAYFLALRIPQALRHPGSDGYETDYPFYSDEVLRPDDEVIGVQASPYSDTPHLVSDDEITAILCFPTLRRLDLSHCSIRDVQLRQIATLRWLEWLVLDDTPIGDEGVANLGAMPSLSFLNLSRTKISDAAVEHFLSMRRLDTLFLGGTGITDEGFRRLAADQSLRNLTVSDCITDEGLVHLSELPCLEHVALFGSRGITTAGVMRLKQLRPGLTGLFGEPLWDPSQKDDGGKSE